MVADREPSREGGIPRVGSLIYGADREVSRWVAGRISGFQLTDAQTALGVWKKNRIVAGVVYERYNGVHLEASIAAIPGSGWADRSTLFGLFYYPFGTLGCRAISVVVPVSNLESLNLATKLGFAPEAIVRFAAHDGGDLAVLKMYRDTCRWIDHGQELQRAEAARPVQDGLG